MNTYLTTFTDRNDGIIYCGPDIQATDWDSAEDKLFLLKSAALYHPTTEIYGELFERAEVWDSEHLVNEFVSFFLGEQG